MYVIPHNNKSVSTPQKLLKDNQKKVILVDGQKLIIEIDGGEVIVLAGDKPLPGYYEMWFSWATNHQLDGLVIEKFN